MPEGGLDRFATRMHSEYLWSLNESHKAQGLTHAPMNWTADQTSFMDGLEAPRRSDAWANYYKDDMSAEAPGVKVSIQGLPMQSIDILLLSSFENPFCPTGAHLLPKVQNSLGFK